MSNGQSMCCALRDHLRIDPHWQLANLSQPACEILFQHWVVTDRNFLSSLSPNERLTCPLLWCGISFVDNESLLRHLKDCPQLSASGYWCPRCHRAESFACTKIPEPIPRSDNRSPACTKIPEPITRSDNRSPVHKKESRFRKLFCKQFSRKRVTDREDPTTKPEPIPQELHYNRSMEMNAHGLRHDPILHAYELDAPVETIEDTWKHYNRVLEMNAHGLHHDSRLYSHELEDTRNVITEKDGNSIVKFPDRASGQPCPPRYDNGNFSEPENPLHSPANLDSAPRSLLSGYGSAPATSLVQNGMKLSMDPPLLSTTMNVPPQNSPLSASSSQTNTTWSGESTGTALNSVTSFSSSCSPNSVCPRHISKSSNSPLSASSSQTNTTWSGESTGTALNSGTSFSSSCSPNSVSPRHISKSSAKSPRRLRKGKLHCQWCDNFFTDPSNLARHKKKKGHGGDDIFCRAGCGTQIAGGRSDNERRHYITQRRKELKESDTKLHKLFHRDYAIKKGEVVRCRAGCDVYFTHDDEVGHYTTQVQKELEEGDTNLRKLMHHDYAIRHGDVAHCRAGCGVHFTHLDDEAGHYTTQIQKEQEEGDTIHKPMHLDYAVLHGDVVPCPAGCGLQFTQDDDEDTHYHTQFQKELGGNDKELDKARPLDSIHLDFFFNISDDSEVMGLDS